MAGGGRKSPKKSPPGSRAKHPSSWYPHSDAGAGGEPPLVYQRPPDNRTPWQKFKDDPGPPIVVAFVVTVVVVRIVLEIR